MLRVFLVTALLASASAASAADPARPQPELDPLAFFSGEVRGEGTVKVMMKAATAVRSESRGTADGKGGMILEQKVYEAGNPVRNSRWILQPTSKSTLKGTVSNAPGPVSGRLSGNRLHLKYPMPGGLAAEQYMYLQPDRRTLLNRITVRKFGIVVARIEERMRKVP